MHCVDLLKASAASSELKEFKQSGLLDAACDITLESLAPVRLNTPLLQANAHLDLHLQGALHAPDVTGSIDLVSGKIMFPYKPLHLIHGTLIFLPRRLEDPIIEITAKNTIKRYNVGMQIVGSLKEPRVLLSAAPSLTDEQIIGLLFVGTHTASLSALMPTVAVNNLAHLIFGAQAPFDATRLLKKIPLPFEHIRLIPSLSDQTARGGLRGSIEIDINERWRAYIQRNFTLTEDTRFELEYAVSDDMSVRGVRDEQGDVGAEVEMRWKF
jgi:hypothetical protein